MAIREYMDKTSELADSQALGLESLTTSDTQVVLVVKTVQAGVSFEGTPTTRVVLGLTEGGLVPVAVEHDKPSY